jgi:enterochelin esterase family protein
MAGRANFILDNLIAEGRAVPMIVVMPAGHVPRVSLDETLAGVAGGAFGRDFLEEVVPYVEANYRVRAGPRNRAIAGLSMGGLQTLQVGLTHLDMFSQLGVFSAGFFGDGAPQRFAAANERLLRDRRTNGRIRLFWIATGVDDFVMPATRATRAMLDQYGIRYTYRETPGGHTWPNWRSYLREFAPLLFR